MKPYSFARPLLLLLTLAVSGSAFADSTYLTFTGVGGQNLGGAYVAPYYGVLSSAPLNPNPPSASTPKIEIICDDWQDDVFLQNPNEYWQVTVTNLGTQNVSETKFDNLTNYDEAAYLVYEMGLSANSSQIADIQFAIWDLMDPGYLGTSNHLFSTTGNTSLPWGGTINATDGQLIDSWIGNAQTEAANNFTALPAGYFSDVEILTPVGGTQVPVGDGPPQEYITVVPEPGTITLLVTGFLGVMSRRKKIL